jgi:hypothetical protein
MSGGWGISLKNSFVKSLPTSLFQREEKFFLPTERMKNITPLRKRG